MLRQVTGERSARALAVLCLLVVTSSVAPGTTAEAQAPSPFPGGDRVRPTPAAQSPGSPTRAAPPAETAEPARATPRDAEPTGPLGAQAHDCETLFAEGDDGPDDGHVPLHEGEECFRDPQTRWLWSLGFFAGPTQQTQWDESLAARGYGPSDVLFGGETSLLRRLGTYFAVGARTSVRDLRWIHHERPAASIFGWDLLVVLDARLPLGRSRVVSLGVDGGGGLGLALSSVNAGRATDVGWRVQASGLLSIRAVGPASITLRLGYDHFPVTVGDSLDARLGGFRTTLALEIVE